MFAGILIFVSQLVTVAALDDGRVEVSTLIKGTTPAAHAEALIALMRAAEKACEGRGRAFSAGPLVLEASEPDKKGKQRLKISEVYFCGLPKT